LPRTLADCRQCRLHAQKHALDVDRLHVAEFFDGRHRHRLQKEDPRVVDQDVEAAEPPLRFGDNGLPLPLVAHVVMHISGACAFRCDRSRGRFAVRIENIRDQHGRTFGCKRGGGRRTQPAGTTRYQCDASLKFPGHVSILCVFYECSRLFVVASNNPI
jgi:hypothetical protein